MDVEQCREERVGFKDCIERTEQVAIVLGKEDTFPAMPMIHRGLSCQRLTMAPRQLLQIQRNRLCCYTHCASDRKKDAAPGQQDRAPGKQDTAPGHQGRAARKQDRALGHQGRAPEQHLEQGVPLLSSIGLAQVARDLVRQPGGEVKGGTWAAEHVHPSQGAQHDGLALPQAERPGLQTPLRQQQWHLRMRSHQQHAHRPELHAHEYTRSESMKTWYTNHNR